MKKILGVGMLGVLAFAAALGAGWWMSQPADKSAHGEHAAAAHTEEGHGTTSQVVDQAHEAGDSHGEHTGADGAAELPLPVRPRALSTEEIFEIAMRLQDREAAVAQREAHLETRQDDLNLVMGDLQREQQEIEGVRAEVRSLLQSGEDLLRQLNAAQQSLTQQEARIQSLLTQAEEAGAAEIVANQENLRHIADIFKGMEPQAAAEQLASIADQGDMDFVIQVFAQLEDRDSAAIGEMFTDKKLFTDIITGLRDYEQPGSAGPVVR